MSEAWNIKALKNKRNVLRERLEKRKKERHGYMFKMIDAKPKIELGLPKYDITQTIIKTEDESTLELEAEIEKTIIKLFCSSNLVLPIISTQIIEKLEKHLITKATRSIVDYTLSKLETHGALNIQSVTIGQDVGCEVVAVHMSVLQEVLQNLMKDHFEIKDEIKRKCNDESVESTQVKKSKNNGVIKRDINSSVDYTGVAASDEIMSLLALPSTREKQSKQAGEEILELLTKPTAKERSVVEKFQSHGGAQVMEFCPHGTKVECLKAQQAMAEMELKKKNDKQKIPECQDKDIDADNTEETTGLTELSEASESDCVAKKDEVLEEEESDENCKAEDDDKLSRDNCTKLHFKKILQSHTDETLGDCSFLNTCFHMATCKYVHYEVDSMPNNNNASNTTNVKSNVSLKRGADPRVTLYPPQWIQCDLRFLDMSVLGKFAVVMADPPWDIHMELPYGTMSDDEMRQLGVPALQDDGLIFLWVTGRAMELGRECLKLWGYERVDELIWVKTNQLQRIIRTGRTGHWLNHGKEHCLVGMKGNPKNLNRGLDCDVIVAEVRATSHKPDEIYGIIERLSPGTRKIELFGRPHNVQPNWITLGNQLDGIRLVDSELVKQFQKRYPDGNCMSPAGTAVGVLPTPSP